jgi:hypothetical protein
MTQTLRWAVRAPFAAYRAEPAALTFRPATPRFNRQRGVL